MRKKKDAKQGGESYWRGGSWRPGWWCTVQLEVVRPAVCIGHGWKKKEQSPAKEKESSRLELLVWLRRELLPRLPKSFWARRWPLERVVVAAAAGVAVVKVEKSFARKRGGEREVLQLPREVAGC